MLMAGLVGKDFRERGSGNPDVPGEIDFALAVFEGAIDAWDGIAGSE